MKRLFILFTFIAAFVLGGCAATQKMALQNSAEKITEASPPLFLMTVDLKNEYRSRYQPQLLSVNIEKRTSAEKPELLRFSMDNAGTVYTGKDEDQTRYLLRMGLEPGAYEIRNLMALGRAFPFHALFFAPLNFPLSSTDKGVFYLGHVRASVRERQGNEFRAGPVIPLIDQGVAGASGGTFDIVVSDQWDTDQALFEKNFPALKGIEVRKSLVPAFDRAKAQKLWEAQ